MEHPEDIIRENRRNATVLGTVNIAGLIMLVFVAVKLFPDAAQQDWQVLSILGGYLVIAGTLSWAWISRIRRRARK